MISNALQTSALDEFGLPSHLQAAATGHALSADDDPVAGVPSQLESGHTPGRLNVDPAEVPAPSSASSPKRKGTKKREAGLFRKAPQAPKRFKSSYICFYTAKQPEIKEMLGDKASVGDISRKSAEMWKALSKEDRAHWDEVAEKDKQRYMAEKASYTGPWQVPWKRARKDPSAPKRPMSAFLFFSQGKRQLIKDRNPGMKNTEISRILGEMWRSAPESERKPHIDQEKAEREKYKIAMAKWRKDFDAKAVADQKRRAEQAAKWQEHQQQQFQQHQHYQWQHYQQQQQQLLLQNGQQVPPMQPYHHQYHPQHAPSPHHHRQQQQQSKNTETAGSQGILDSDSQTYPCEPTNAQHSAQSNGNVAFQGYPGYGSQYYPVYAPNVYPYPTDGRRPVILGPDGMPHHHYPAHTAPLQQQQEQQPYNANDQQTHPTGNQHQFHHHHHHQSSSSPPQRAQDQYAGIFDEPSGLSSTLHPDQETQDRSRQDYDDYGGSMSPAPQAAG